MATDAYKTPLPVYVDKLELIYAWVKIPVAGGLLAVLAMVARWRFPRAWMAFKRSLPAGMWGMAGAGAVLGLTNSIRVAAPLAGLLVSAALLVRLGRRAWLPLGVYGLSAGVTTYLTWPWLWLSPAANYWESLRVMSNFPSHRVLFGGTVYSSSDIPWDYVPRLITIQTTEIVLPLFLLGLLVWLGRERAGGQARLDSFLWLAWLGIPIGLVIVLGSSLYGNLRQMLFVLPPLFLIGGKALELIGRRVTSRCPRCLVLGLLAPGLGGIISLHPYEDSYFNGWVGWTSGAYGRYQVDPWCTAYREATQHLNALAPPGANVDVRGPFQSAQDFARADLNLHPDFAPFDEPDFALMCQIDVLGDGFEGDLPIAYRVTRGRAVLAVLRGPR